MRYWLVDVFAERPLAGNGLTVFPDSSGLSADLMQSLAQELRQFETSFLQPTAEPELFETRVFTMEEELPFAGHPVLGAAALLHHLDGSRSSKRWRLRLNAHDVPVTTRRAGDGIEAVMDQGPAVLTSELSAGTAQWFADAFASERDERYPAQVISTGLPYLILPVTSKGLARARQRGGLEPRLSEVGAAFVYLLDVDAREGRTWDTDGVVEDIATGSAAGPVASYLHNQQLTRHGETVYIHQGRFTGRSSRMMTKISTDGRVEVGGTVHVIAVADLLPLRS
ncbi:PhzF family phenazine biosynthesis protein [Microbacterium sp. NPDC058269]|uniref:PhzF family phenazine biosynthesis protein n=1 Tax=Microbacterium sp. NPDC058269 TaxID=3346414 RepID=UPI0036DC007C